MCHLQHGPRTTPSDRRAAHQDRLCTTIDCTSGHLYIRTSCTSQQLVHRDKAYITTCCTFCTPRHKPHQDFQHTTTHPQHLTQQPRPPRAHQSSNQPTPTRRFETISCFPLSCSYFPIPIPSEDNPIPHYTFQHDTYSCTNHPSIQPCLTFTYPCLPNPICFLYPAQLSFSFCRKHGSTVEFLIGVLEKGNRHGMARFRLG